MNRWRMVQVETSAYVSGFRTPFLSSVEVGDSLSVDDIRRRYIHKAVATTFYLVSSRGRLDSVTILAELLVEGASHEFKQLKRSVSFGRVLSFVRVCKELGKGISCSLRNRRACPVCDQDPTLELCFVRWYEILKKADFPLGNIDKALNFIRLIRRSSWKVISCRKRIWPRTSVVHSW